MTTHRETENQALPVVTGYNDKPFLPINELRHADSAQFIADMSEMVEILSYNGESIIDCKADVLFRLIVLIEIYVREYELAEDGMAGGWSNYPVEALLGLLFPKTSFGERRQKDFAEALKGQPSPAETEAAGGEAEEKRPHILQIGEQIAAFIDHPQTPEIIVKELTNFWFEIHNETTPSVTPENASRQLRRLWPDLVDEMLKQEAESVSEVED